MTEKTQKFRHPEVVAALFARAAKAIIGEPVPPPHEAAAEIAAALRTERKAKDGDDA